MTDNNNNNNNSNNAGKPSGYFSLSTSRSSQSSFLDYEAPEPNNDYGVDTNSDGQESPNVSISRLQEDSFRNLIQILDMAIQVAEGTGDVFDASPLQKPNADDNKSKPRQ